MSIEPRGCAPDPSIWDTFAFARCAQINLSGRAEFHVRMPMCGRFADGTLSIGVVKLLRIVIVFDAADLNAESAFWAGRARPCARGMA
jgi:hypothetical protein